MLCVVCQLPKQSFPTLLDYISALQGAARQRLLDDAQRVLSEAAKAQRTGQLSDEKAEGESSAIDSSIGSNALSAENKLRKRAVQRANKIVRVLS